MTRPLTDARSVTTESGSSRSLRPALLDGGVAPSPVGLVARDRELSELERALGQCRVGGSAVVVLRGEPGTGKSALVAAVATRARDFVVVRLRGSRAGSDEPSAAWPAPLRELLERCVAGEGDGGAERAAAALGTLGTLAGVPVLVTLDDAELLPATFLQAIVTAVETEQVAHPTLAVLALSDLPLVENQALSVAPVSLCRLGGLTVDQAGSLLERVLGLRAPAGVVQGIHHAVGGNPQALLSVGTTLADEVLKGWQPLPDPVGLEPSLQRAFGACLEALPAPARHGLAAAASGRIPVRVLEAALGELELDLGCFDPAVERGIVVLRRSRITFAHPLVRAAAYHGAPEAVRVEAHKALSHAFGAAGMTEMSAEHARRSSAPATTVLGLYGQAVRVALDRADLRLAARYQEAMADIVGSDETVLQHLTRAAAWWMSAGDLERASHCLERAAALATPEALRGSLVYWRSRARMAQEVDGRLADELAAAAALQDPDGSDSAALVLGEAAVCLLVAGEPARAEDLARRALDAAARAGGFPGAFAGAVTAAVAVLGRLGPDGGEQLRPATSFLMSQPDALPLSPLFALVVGRALLEQSGAGGAATWAGWLDQTGATTGNVALEPVARLLEAHVALRAGELDDAARLAEAATAGASGHGQRVIAVRALGVLLEAQSLQGRYQPAFVTASRLFADAADGERPLRAAAYRSLAELELQRSRVPSALSWLKAAEYEVTAQNQDGQVVDPRQASWVAALAEVLVHDQRPEAVRQVVDLVDGAARAGAIEPAWSPAARGVVADSLEAAESLFNASLRLARDEPAVRARIEYLYAARLSAEGLAERAARRLHAAATTARDIGALGWATLFELALERLETAAPTRPDLALVAGGDDVAGVAEPIHPAGADRVGATPKRFDPAASWEISMLGAFNVRHEDELISMPTSLAATALKLVALRRRILVEELVEELWPESAPGVGQRRLRNVLWRVRLACGDILVRDDKLLQLAPEAVTDVEVFRRLAVQALDPSTPEEKSAELARFALSLYEGELLPTDRYADWAAATRESLARLQIQLVELRVRQAITEQRVHEALGLLDQLIEADPYDERHYLRVAELHEQTGNRRLAVTALGRAERTLAELGIPPSPEMRRLSERLR